MQVVVYFVFASVVLVATPLADQQLQQQLQQLEEDLKQQLQQVQSH